ncbi:hypothetical protein HaLaN_07859, partial [Haematococcus lacustris]
MRTNDAVMAKRPTQDWAGLDRLWYPLHHLRHAANVRSGLDSNGQSGLATTIGIQSTVAFFLKRKNRKVGVGILPRWLHPRRGWLDSHWPAAGGVWLLAVVLRVHSNSLAVRPAGSGPGQSPGLSTPEDVRSVDPWASAVKRCVEGREGCVRGWER